MLDSYPRNPDTKRPEVGLHVPLVDPRGLKEHDLVGKNRKESVGIEPRGLSVPKAAAYYGISPNAYRSLMREGKVPRPIKIPSLKRQIIDKLQLDAALDALSKGAA